MDDMNSVVKLSDFGEIRLKLAEYIDEVGIKRNKLSDLTGIKYSIIDRYYKNIAVERVDLTILAKICFVLKCSLSDILEYYPPSK